MCLACGCGLVDARNILDPASNLSDQKSALTANLCDLYETSDESESARNSKNHNDPRV